jgi:AcrR family transcriptional regulator
VPDSSKKKEPENRWVSEPKQKRTRERLDRIYKSADALFDAQGFENTTLRQVAAEVPCSMSTIYDRFESKDALLLAMHERLRQRVLVGMPLLAPKERPAHLDLEGWIQLSVRGACTSMANHRGLRRAVMERCISSEVVAQKELDHRKELCGYFVRGLALYKDDIRHPNAKVASRRIYSMLTAVVSQRYDMRLEPPGSGLSDERFIQECVRMCLAYLLHSA